MQPEIITFNGQARTVAQWATVVGISRQTIYNRLNAGWSIEEALTVPISRGPKGRGNADRTKRYHRERSLNHLCSEFSKLINSIDRALRVFNRHLSALETDTPGVVETPLKNAPDRTSPVAQDGV